MPVFDALKALYPHAVAFKIDADHNREVAAYAGISAYPTFQIWKGGVKGASVSGPTEARLKTLFEEC